MKDQSVSSKTTFLIGMLIILVCSLGFTGKSTAAANGDDYQRSYQYKFDTRVAEAKTIDGYPRPTIHRRGLRRGNSQRRMIYGYKRNVFSRVQRRSTADPRISGRPQPEPPTRRF